MIRLSKDEYFIQLAEVVAKRSTCLDKQVGCVLVDDMGIVLSTGYNGAPHGHIHCIDIGFCRKDDTGNMADCPSAHAEQNAVIHCPDCRDVYTVYLTLSPCISCVRMLLNTGCHRIVYRKPHRHKQPLYLWSNCRPENTWIQED